jgi:hypothetical protein
MRTDKPNVNGSFVEMNHGYEPEFISFDVENKTVISHAIYICEICNHFMGRFPICIFCDQIPSDQCFRCSRIQFAENGDSVPGNDNHQN